MAGEDVLQQLMGDMAAKLRQGDIVGSAGGGAVTVRLAGERVASVRIDPSVAGDVGMLEELVAAAMNDALGRAAEGRRAGAAELLGQLTGGGLALPELPPR